MVFFLDNYILAPFCSYRFIKKREVSQTNDVISHMKQWSRPPQILVN